MTQISDWIIGKMAKSYSKMGKTSGKAGLGKELFTP